MYTLYIGPTSTVISSPSLSELADFLQLHCSCHQRMSSSVDTKSPATSGPAYLLFAKSFASSAVIACLVRESIGPFSSALKTHSQLPTTMSCRPALSPNSITCMGCDLWGSKNCCKIASSSQSPWVLWNYVSPLATHKNIFIGLVDIVAQAWMTGQWSSLN